MIPPIDSQLSSKNFKRLRLLGLDRLDAALRETPSCVLLQIDGLSYKNFRRALMTRKFPFLSRLLRRQEAVASPWQAILPTSTSAFQACLFYGNNDNIPGFFWYDKARRVRVQMNGNEDTTRVEAELRERVKPYPGLLARGSSYSALFTGGADNTFLTFAKMFSPRYNLTVRRGWLFVFLLSQVLLFARVLYYSAIEFCLAIYDFVSGIFTKKDLYLELKFLFPRIFSVVICREIATLAAILDIYRGVGPIYVNYFAYDEHAHHRGPNSHFAFWTLRGIDASIRRIWKAAQRTRRRQVRRYDVFVWSDHGQTPSVPFQRLFGDLPERHFDMLFRALYGPTPEPPAIPHDRAYPPVAAPASVTAPDSHLSPAALGRQAKRTEFSTGFGPRWLRALLGRLMRPAAETRMRREPLNPPDPQQRLFLVSSGPMAHLCLPEWSGPMTYEDWLEHYPRFMDVIAQHRGIGFTLTRTRAQGCMVGIGGKWFDLDDDAALGAVASPYLAPILRERREDFRRWVSMPACGDLLIFGQRDAGQEVIAYSYEHGSHGGPSPQETLPFILIPAEIAPQWPEIGPERGERLLTLDALQERLRRTYPPQPAAEPRPQPPIAFASAPHDGRTCGEAETRGREDAENLGKL